MTLTTQSNNYEFINEPPRITWVLSGIDSASGKISTLTFINPKSSEANIANFITGNIESLIYADDSSNSSNTGVRFELLNPLNRLNKRVIKQEYKANYENIITFLNKNPAGVVFENYNLSSLQSIFSNSVYDKTWFQILQDLSSQNGFDFWWDYDKNVCMLGVPDKIIVLNETNFKYDRGVSRPLGASFNFSQIKNRIIAKTGINGNIDMSFATIVDSNYPVKTATDEFGNTYSYIENAESIDKYGVYESYINSVNLNRPSASSEDKVGVANLLYQQALQQIKRQNKPQVVIPEIKILSKERIKIGSKVKLSTSFCNIPDLEIDDEYLVTSINLSLTQECEEQEYIMSLANYVDKSSRLAQILERFSRADQLPPSSSNQNESLAISGSFDTSTFQYTLTQSSYNLQDKFKLGITSYTVSVSINLTTGTRFEMSSLLIDNIAIPDTKLTVNSTQTDNSAVYNITNNDNLNQSQKLTLENIGNHTVQVIGSGDGNVNITVSVSINGYV